MRGIVRYIRKRGCLSSLIDRNGTERTFKRSELVQGENVKIEPHDAVSFTLDGNRVHTITLVKKHRNIRTVFSFGG